MNRYVIQAITHLATAQAGAEKMNSDLEERARTKWEKSKSLPRKQKKLLRKDALLDWAIAHHVLFTANNILW